MPCYYVVFVKSTVTETVTTLNKYQNDNRSKKEAANAVFSRTVITARLRKFWRFYD